MSLVITGKDKSTRINKIFELIVYVIGYTLAFLFVQLFFDTFRIDDTHKFLYSLLAVCIIYVLDKTVKPLLVTLTIPITGITLGLFYFVINALILKVVDWIMGSKLDFTNIWSLFFISILLSAVNFIIEDIIIKPILKRAKK